MENLKEFIIGKNKRKKEDMMKTEEETRKAIKDYFIMKGKANSRYESDGNYEGNERKCINCKRKQMSYPDTCNDGWKTLRKEIAHKNDCINFISA